MAATRDIVLLGSLAALSLAASSLVNKVSVCIISSPSPLHPSTAQVWRVIDSLSHLGLEEARLHIVCDGVRTRPSIEDIKGKNPHAYAMSKQGVVTEGAAQSYDAYMERLERELEVRFGISGSGSGNVREWELERLPERCGFANAVRHALEHSPLEMVLVCQHDRAFVSAVPLSDLVAHLESDGGNRVRYVGFSTFKSRGLLRDYEWPLLPEDGEEVLTQVLHVPEQLLLRAMPFWYDSNHLAVRERYLEIFTPFKSLPSDCLERLGKASVAKLRLRRGDFIEDRFGQQQRTIFALLAEEAARGERGGAEMADVSRFARRMVDWFGCYMLNTCDDRVMVSHLGGRKYAGPNRELRPAEEATGE